MAGTRRLQDLTQQWEATKTSLPKQSNANASDITLLNEILRQCIQEGAVLTDSDNRASLQLLARDIADTVFRLTGDYPDAAICPATRPIDNPYDISKLPDGIGAFFGRKDELQLLDDAWSKKRTGIGCTQIVELVAPGGAGKTALVKHWLDRLRRDDWQNAQRVYCWSFANQGSSDDRQGSDDDFISAALDWFMVGEGTALSTWYKGKRLARTMAATRTLLVLDGVEPLQYPPGPLAGQLRAPGVKALLTQLASGGHPGLCIITSRDGIRDLDDYLGGHDRPDGTVIRHDLENLSPADGARLLHDLGVCHAGAADIGPDDPLLLEASRDVHGHALTLTLLGSYLAQAHGGDIRQRDKVAIAEADDALGGHAFRVMATYERFFEEGGEQSKQMLAVLRLLGYFDGPADAGCLAALRQAPPIAEVTEPLTNLTEAHWNLNLTRLRDTRLIEWSEPDTSGADAAAPSIDAHPLVRAYLADSLRKKHPGAWREGHRRLYEHLKASVPHQPDTLTGLQPLYQAVAHGCLAGMHQEAFDAVYRDRIQRGTANDDFYSTTVLGAFGPDLSALACFFTEPWQRVYPAFSEHDQAWLLYQSAFSLRALGRLTEAREPMQHGLAGAKKLGEWQDAAKRATDLSELKLTLGDVSEAVRDTEVAVTFAENSKNPHWIKVAYSTRAYALHDQGDFPGARQCFDEAETNQAKIPGAPPPLQRVQGFRYCELLLADAERIAWQRQSMKEVDGTDAIATCLAVQTRGLESLGIAQYHKRRLIMALDNLTVGRAALLQAVLNHPTSCPELLSLATPRLLSAVEGLRDAGRQEYLPLGYLALAWLNVRNGDEKDARTNLEEAWQIASRGLMRLHMADVHLHRARLFRDPSELAKARKLIDQCGYERRRQELNDAQEHLL